MSIRAGPRLPEGACQMLPPLPSNVPVLALVMLKCSRLAPSFSPHFLYLSSFINLGNEKKKKEKQEEGTREASRQCVSLPTLNLLPETTASTDLVNRPNLIKGLLEISQEE